MVVELATGLAFAGLYLWEVHYLALYSFVGNAAPPAPGWEIPSPPLPIVSC